MPDIWITELNLWRIHKHRIYSSVLYFEHIFPRNNRANISNSLGDVGTWLGGGTYDYNILQVRTFMNCNSTEKYRVLPMCRTKVNVLTWVDKIISSIQVILGHKLHNVYTPYVYACTHARAHTPTHPHPHTQSLQIGHLGQKSELPSHQILSNFLGVNIKCPSAQNTVYRGRPSASSPGSTPPYPLTSLINWKLDVK